MPNFCQVLLTKLKKYYFPMFFLLDKIKKMNILKVESKKLNKEGGELCLGF